MAAGIAIISVNRHPVFLASEQAAGSMSLILRFYVTYSDTNVTNSENLVRPGKADMFSGSQSHRGKSQKPLSLGRTRGGNETEKAD